MTAELHQTNINMEGLLEVLGKNLYSTPTVAIRELVQNSHDACIRRKIEDSHSKDLRISLSVDTNEQSLIIEDNGSGLTYDEVLQFLATIGSGYTRLLRNQADTEEMIGYFGLGFLSAYVIASKVDVWTTSFKEPETTWHFTSKGGKQFSIEPVASRSVGTLVKLKVSDSFRELTSLSVLSSLLSQYCCLLPIPIYVKGQAQPVNESRVPWIGSNKLSPLKLKKEQLQFAELFEESFKPICVIPIPEENELAVNGLIWIQDSSGYSTSDYRNVSVFVRNMFITHKGRELLPLWAGFVGCVVESHRLTPTASREDLQEDEAYRELQRYLAKTLVSGLKHLSESEPENWRRILTRHNQALMGAAVNDDVLFEILKNELKVPTNNGEMTVPVLLSQSKRNIYVRLENKNNYEDVLFRARMIPVVSGYMFAAFSFCKKYADYNSLKMIQLGTRQGDKELFEQIQPEALIKAKLSLLIQERGERLFFARFSPEHVPMIIIEDKDVVLKKRIEQDGIDKRVGSAALSLAKLHTNSINDDIERRVFINLNCQLIKKLCDDSLEEEKAAHLAKLLRSFMVTICHDSNDGELGFSEQLARFEQSLLAII